VKDPEENPVNHDLKRAIQDRILAAKTSKSPQIDPQDHDTNADFISQLVDEFYDRIHAHGELGPIFTQALGGNWDTHLTHMKSFWRSVALGTGEYSGRPVPKHKALPGIEPHHFELWLNLFEQTLNDIAPTSAVPPFFMERATRIGLSLQLAIFGLPITQQG